MRAPSPFDPRRGARGAVTWVSLLLLIVLGGGAYLAWTWAPVYVRQFQVKQIVRDYMNRAVKNPRDAELKDGLVYDVRRLDTKDGVDEYGRPAKVPVIDLRPDDVHWERDTNVKPPVLHVWFDYEHVVEYPFLDRTASKVMSVDLTEELAVPDWGLTR